MVLGCIPGERPAAANAAYPATARRGSQPTTSDSDTPFVRLTILLGPVTGCRHHLLSGYQKRAFPPAGSLRLEVEVMGRVAARIVGDLVRRSRMKLGRQDVDDLVHQLVRVGVPDLPAGG